MNKDLKFHDFQTKCPEEKIFVKSYPGSTISDMSHYIQPTANRSPNLFLIQIGTNNVRDSESAEKTAKEILEIAASVKTTLDCPPVYFKTIQSRKAIPSANKLRSVATKGGNRLAFFV